MTHNPLFKNFRQPAIYIKLPSNGSFWPEDSIQLPVTGEVAVYPMTAKDEIVLKTPDALMNGAGLVSVIQSCCPAISNAWDCPSIDLDTLLISIRIASYGETMSVSSNCSYCKAENEHQANLQHILAKLQAPDYSKPIVVEGLSIFVKPQKYFDFNKRNLIEFEEQQLLKLIQQTNVNETEKAVLQIQLDNHLSKILELNFQLLTTSTTKIVTEDGVEVTNPEFISEFYQNSKAIVTRTVQQKIKEVSQDIVIKPFPVACSECSKEYKVELTFDYSHFFV